jgi:uncharacterized protein YhaN
MKISYLAAASGLVLSAFFVTTPAGAQGSYPTPSGERVDANGMPTTQSTPEEKAQTSQLNDQAATADAQVQNQNSANNDQYQAQQQQYQQQQQQYQQQLEQNRAQQERFENRTAMYENLRAHYAAERAAYHRDLWPERDWSTIDRDSSLVGGRIELIRGNRV